MFFTKSSPRCFLAAVDAFQSGEEDTMETIEAAEALLNMDSPSSLSLTLDEKHLCESQSGLFRAVSPWGERKTEQKSSPF